QYQIQKVIKASESATSNANEKAWAASNKSKDVSKYRPIPGNLISKIEPTAQDDDGDDVYRPPRISPTSIDMDQSSKQETNAILRDREILKQAKQRNFHQNNDEGSVEEVEDRPGNEDPNMDDEDMRRRRRDLLQHRIRDFSKMEGK
ncbi:hypothetical protein RYX36_031558, partial [Vicia faba]